MFFLVSKWGKYTWYERCLLVYSLRKKIKSLKKQVTRLSCICEQKDFIDIEYKKTSKIVEEIQ